MKGYVTSVNTSVSMAGVVEVDISFKAIIDPDEDYREVIAGFQSQEIFDLGCRKLEGEEREAAEEQLFSTTGKRKLIY